MRLALGMEEVGHVESEVVEWQPLGGVGHGKLMVLLVAWEAHAGQPGAVRSALLTQVAW